MTGVFITRGESEHRHGRMAHEGRGRDWPGAAKGQAGTAGSHRKPGERHGTHFPSKPPKGPSVDINKYVWIK